MGHATFSALALICFLLFTLPCAAPSSHADTGLEYQNGLVSVQKFNISLINFLEDLSELANIKIYLVETVDPARRIRVNFDHQQIEKVLRSVLRGYNHAIIFNGQQISKAAVFSYNVGGNAKTNQGRSPTYGQMEDHPMPGGSHPTSDEKEDKIKVLTQRISQLNQRIESGESDKEYEKWVKVRGPKYVVHDRDRLKAYQSRLTDVFNLATTALR